MNTENDTQQNTQHYSTLPEAVAPPPHYSGLEHASATTPAKPYSPSAMSPLSPDPPSSGQGSYNPDGKDLPTSHNAAVDEGRNAKRGRRICGLSMRWFIVVVVVVVLAIGGGVAGGVIASKPKGSGKSTAQEPTPTSPTPPSTTSDTATSTPTELKAERPFDSDTWYYITTENLDSNNTILSISKSDKYIANDIQLGYKADLGTRLEHFWQLAPAPPAWANASVPHPDGLEKRVGVYWIRNRAVGLAQSLITNTTSRSADIGEERDAVFLPHDVADLRQYWYLSKEDSRKAGWEIRSVSLGTTWALAAQPWWGTPQVSRLDRSGEGTSASRSWIVQESGQKVDPGEVFVGRLG